MPVIIPSCNVLVPDLYSIKLISITSHRHKILCYIFHSASPITKIYMNVIKKTQVFKLWVRSNWGHIDGLVQERHNSIANARELRLSCTNPLMWYMYQSINVVIIGSSKGLLLVHDKAITWIWDDLSIGIPGTKLESNLNDFFFQEISFENPSFTMWTNFVEGCMYWTFSHYCILLFTLGCHSIALMMFLHGIHAFSFKK